MNSRIIFLSVVIFLASNVACAQLLQGKATEKELKESRQAGKENALLDSKNKELYLMCFGCTQSPDSLLESTQLASYHISYKDLGDVTPDTMVAYAAEYNGVIKAEIEKRYGAKFLEKFHLK